MRILALVAGTNTPSNSDMLADAFLDGARGKKATVDKLYVRDLRLEQFSLKFYDPKTDQGAAFRKLQKAVQSADGILIATPIWNFSVPAHLKNMIDRMGSFCLDATHSVGTLNGKPVFLLYTGGTPIVAWYGLQRQTVSHLPVALRYFGAVVTGTHYEELSTLGRGRFGLIVDKRRRSIRAMKAKGRHFALVVQTKADTGHLPRREALLLKAFQTAQRIKRRIGL